MRFFVARIEPIDRRREVGGRPVQIGHTVAQDHCPKTDHATLRDSTARINHYYRFNNFLLPSLLCVHDHELTIQLNH